MSLLLWHELLSPVLSYLEPALVILLLWKQCQRDQITVTQITRSPLRKVTVSPWPLKFIVFSKTRKMSINDPNSSSDKFFLSNHGNWNLDLNSFPFDPVQVTQFVNDLAESCNFLWDLSLHYSLSVWGIDFPHLTGQIALSFPCWSWRPCHCFWHLWLVKGRIEAEGLYFHELFQMDYVALVC